MDRSSAVFCLLALAASLALAGLGFSLAALPRETIAAATTPAAPESLPDVDLGEGFGKVPVLELVGYYLDNPPGTAASRVEKRSTKRFGGC